MAVGGSNIRPRSHVLMASSSMSRLRDVKSDLDRAVGYHWRCLCLWSSCTPTRKSCDNTTNLVTNTSLRLFSLSPPDLVSMKDPGLLQDQFPGGSILSYFFPSLWHLFALDYFQRHLTPFWFSNIPFSFRFCAFSPFITQSYPSWVSRVKQTETQICRVISGVTDLSSLRGPFAISSCVSSNPTCLSAGLFFVRDQTTSGVVRLGQVVQPPRAKVS